MVSICTTAKKALLGRSGASVTWHGVRMVDAMCGRARLAHSTGLNDARNELHYLEALVSLAQHSGRSGKSVLSHPPPKAWTSSTAFTMRRPRILTEVSSSERAAHSALVTSR